MMKGMRGEFMDIRKPLHYISRMNILKISDLHVNIDKKNVLRGVNLSVGTGEVHVLMGPNGAGKSTLGHAIMGNPVYTVESGHIYFKGEDITSLSTDKRGRAGIFLSFQNPPEVAGIPLGAFIRTSLRERTGEKVNPRTFRTELHQAAQTLEMDFSYLSRDLNVGFSGGERKKSEILQLLLLRPALAILDETDSGLDVDAVRVVSKGINEYLKGGGTLLIITHSTKILEGLPIDKVHVLVKGTVVHEGGGELVDMINRDGFETFEEKA